MKKLLTILVVATIAISTLGQVDTSKYVLTIKQGKYEKVNNQTYLLVPTTLTNNTNDTLKYLSMSCSWQEFYYVDNDKMSVEQIICTKNGQIMLTLLPHKSVEKEIKLVIEQTISTSKLKFKIGFSLLKVKNNLPYDFNEQEKKKNIIWSNTIAQTTSKQLICKGELVNIYVEKAIFHSPKNNNFLIKVEIKNISNKTIGVDLTDYWKIIYPNQWGISKKPYREVIDEGRMIPDTVIDKTDLINKYNNQTLTFIKPNETIAYYRDWNGSGEKIELTDKKSFLIITIDGQLLLTNGEAVEQIIIGDNEKDRAIVFNYPIVNKTISANALIINK